MADSIDIESTTLLQRVVLLSVALESRKTESPLNSSDLTGICSKYISAIEGDIIGRPREADIIRTLNQLVGMGYLNEDSAGEASPTGKGRPRYVLSDDPEVVLEALRADPRIESALEAIGEEM